MSNLSATKMTWSCLNTKDDLLKLFMDSVDRVVIEEIIAFRNNNCKF